MSRVPLLQLRFVVTRKRAGMGAYLFQFCLPPDLVFHSFDPCRVFSVQVDAHVHEVKIYQRTSWLRVKCQLTAIVFPHIIRSSGKHRRQ